MSPPSYKPIIVVVGAGPGTGFAIARYFAERGHPAALLSRSPERLEGLAKHINDATNDPHRAKAFPADTTDEDSMRKAFEAIKEAEGWKGQTRIGTGVFNASYRKHKSFLDLTPKVFEDALRTSVIGAVIFSQAVIRAIKEHGQGGNLFFTGATASVRGSAGFSAFAAPKFGLRGLSQSLAREFHPQGIHVAHFIIDGAINTELIRNRFGEVKDPKERMSPDSIAKVYYDFSQQEPSVWAHEVDLRPAREKF